MAMEIPRLAITIQKPLPDQKPVQPNRFPDFALAFLVEKIFLYDVVSDGCGH